MLAKKIFERRFLYKPLRPPPHAKTGRDFAGPLRHAGHVGERPERLAALRRAFDAMVADRAFLAEARAFGLTVAPPNGRDRGKAEVS